MALIQMSSIEEAIHCLMVIRLNLVLLLFYFSYCLTIIVCSYDYLHKGLHNAVLLK